MSDKIWFDPTSDKWVLSDGEHYLEVPHWAREIIVNEFERETEPLKAENAKLRELVRGLHMAYVGALNEAEGMDEGLIWEHCEMVDAELAKSHARFEADRHRFDVAMRELEVDG